MKKNVTYIGPEPWEVKMLRLEKWLNRFSWVVIIAAAIYLAPICLWVFLK